MLETDISTIHSSVTPIHTLWKKQEENEEARPVRSEVNIPKPNQTSISWYPKERIDRNSKDRLERSSQDRLDRSNGCLSQTHIQQSH